MTISEFISPYFKEISKKYLRCASELASRDMIDFSLSHGRVKVHSSRFPLGWSTQW